MVSTFKCSLPPEGLAGLTTATDRLARALLDGERIAVCGDYDVDGMTGTALLVRFFRLCGGDVTWSIPDRKRDGYGLSVEAVEFWDIHEMADAEHSEVGDNIVVRHATDAATQARVRDALQHSLDAWWQFFDGISDSLRS